MPDDAIATSSLSSRHEPAAGFELRPAFINRGEPMADEAYRRRQGVATMADADLLLAVINGRLPEVITALDAGVSPDLSYSTGTTLIESISEWPS